MLPAWAMNIPTARERLKIIYELMPEVEQFRSLLAEADPADIIEASDHDDEA